MERGREGAREALLPIGGITRDVRVLLLVSAFNGLSQRAWCALREAGHEVGVLLATTAEEMIDGVRAYAEDVRARRFPAVEHTYSIDPSELEAFREGLAI